MYQAAYYQRNKNLITIWDDTAGMIQIPYKKYAYRKNSMGKHISLDGVKLEKVHEWDDSDIQRNLIYESDINPITRTLIDMYHETDDVSTNHRELFIDIEVSTVNGYADAKDPWQPMTSIAFYDAVGKRYVAIIVDAQRKLKPYTDSNLILEIVPTETDLITKFLTYYLEIRPTIITGWNIDKFDIPYMYNRMTRVVGSQYANTLSPINEVVYNERIEQYLIAGVNSLDYMRLYKTFTYSEEPSYSLEAISRKELKKGKIQFKGTLDHLYATDPEKFVKYNVNDVELVVELDAKLKFLDLARGICHKGHVPYEDIYFTTRYLDGACLTYMKRLGVIAPNRKKHNFTDTEQSNEFAGAFVKDPIPGLYEWVFDEDLSSLYPSIIRTLNISPETKIGRFKNWDVIKDKFIANIPDSTNAILVKAKGSDTESIPVSELRKWLEQNTYSVSAIGVVYNNKQAGLVPAILETWMNEREENRALAKKYGKEGNTKLANFFDARQLTLKIINNSLYGALGAPGFRFHDVDNAESITSCGQAVIKSCMNISNKWYNKRLNTKNIDYVLYVDTDSLFSSAKPFIEQLETKLNIQCSKQQCADITQKVSVELEKHINDSFSEFALNNFNSKKHFLSIKQEYVAESAFWIAKKRYAQKILMEKGVYIKDMTNGEKEWKLDVKGMDVVRSNFPKAFREFMTGILIDILNKEHKEIIDTKVIELRDSLPDKNLLDIMFPTGVKDIEKHKIKTGQVFNSYSKGTPVHVKSAINYNDLMDYFNITGQPIVSGDKIKWTYLKQNFLGLDSCALKGFEDNEKIVKFIEDNIDYESVFESSLENKLSDFYKALKWGAIPRNNTLSDFFSF